MKYEIRHKEILVDYFDVYADSEREALAEFDRLVSEGKIDFSNMEMITSSNTVHADPLQVGDICYYPQCPEAIFMVTRIYYGPDGTGTMTGFFDGLYLNDGSVIQDGTLSLIRTTGEHVDFEPLKNYKRKEN